MPYDGLDASHQLVAGRRLPTDAEGATGGLVEQIAEVESDAEAAPRVERRRERTERSVPTARARVIEEQLDRMAATVRLSEIHRELHQAVIRQSTGEEIDRVVCEHLVDSGWYAAAWVGDVNLAKAQIVPRTVTGVPEELVNAASFDADTDVGALGTAIAAAARGGQIRVVRVWPHSDDPEAFPAFARDRGYRWMIAVPLAFEGIRYGVLTLFSTRKDAFEEYERTVLEELGRTVGHAINATERRQALVGDSFIELDIRLPGVVESLDLSGDRGTGDYTISVEGMIPADTGRIIQYLTVTGISPERFREAMVGMTEVETIREIDGVGDSNRLEAVYTDFPITSTLASYGGRIETVCFDVPDLRLTVALPRSADVRQIDRTLRSEVPDLKIGAQRTVARDPTSAEPYCNEFEKALTEHQRTALMTAFFAGYFEWPRESTGEEIAETLGISPSTFHQHFRVAQQKVFSTIFERKGQCEP